MTHRTKYLLAALLALALALAGCASGGGESPEEPSGETGGEGEGEDGGETAASTEGMRVAYASDLDPNDVADQLGLTEAGADVTTLTEDSAVVAGLHNGDFEIGNVDMTAAIKAIQGGVPLKIVYVAQDIPEFVMVAQGEISELDQLADKTVAYHSPGSLTEILQRELVRQHDPALEDQINWTVLPESPNRAAAMVAGRIHATTLEFLDVVTLQQQGDFNILGTWEDLGGDSANAIATVWAVSESYLEENRDKVAALLNHIQDGYDTFYEDKDAWMSLSAELLPDADPDMMSQAYDYYVDVEMYPQSGTPPLTEERWQSMDGFFRQIGEYEQAAPIDYVDLELAAEVNEG